MHVSVLAPASQTVALCAAQVVGSHSVTWPIGQHGKLVELAAVSCLISGGLVSQCSHTLCAGCYLSAHNLPWARILWLEPDSVNMPLPGPPAFVNLILVEAVALLEHLYRTD